MSTKRNYITHQHSKVSRLVAARIIRRMRADARSAGVPNAVTRLAWRPDLPACVIRTTCAGGIRGHYDAIIIE